MESKGLLLVVSGPSGVGKGTVVKELIKDERFVVSVSATTRQPRNEDINGVTYYFMNQEQFKAMIAENAFLEHACYCGNYYGTPKARVIEQLNAGKNVILEIDVQGYESIKKTFPEAVGVFLMPPSFAALEKRLRGRGTEDEETVFKRISRAFKEISTACHYDYIVVNDLLEQCVGDIKSVVRGEQLRSSRYTV